MSVKYDVVATVGQYEKDGQVKYLNRKVGVIVSTQKGYRLKLDACFNPAGCPQRSDDGGVWLALFEPNKDQPQQQQSATRQDQANDNFDDDIPF
ncbi:hypothetical protein IPC1132_10970 [Pseudomonas aeruginosa]|uniref:hypothetical protein n=1 Tax=Pseudomonas aeruginosa TaxID=287 RepID=UPI000FC4047B|nr:hypothetical protein [Pseudomonas aeruginosa]RUF31664.1 hypothetical protein IPC1132_10970 [Pseudomonas aeruginosa]